LIDDVEIEVTCYRIRSKYGDKIGNNKNNNVVSVYVVVNCVDFVLIFNRNRISTSKELKIKKLDIQRL
jgi:hypothetical protein